MIVVQNRFEIAPGYEEAFVERFSERRGEVESQPGFHHFQLLSPATEDTETFVSMSYWDSLSAYQAWTESEAFERAHDRDAPREMFESHPTLEIHEVELEAGRFTTDA
ncbi:antibiotic biosynthesis monooxygenase [Halodesulfurarchaeum formicicum]|uniref:Antibiotic biosynthesis monooxygenase n=1 Tax=Halodesulfurarchaeum formicicum TaxID=1873524 RepID=A0A1D8S788_9EURY|nr:antibiotic biosynthesis monooxygenase [Halodesulfurarchaeum formicicum]AOW81224.1 antibiotic biosynthesis monooxygenase [Halodesulfurarchaeum formicicum]